MIGDDMKESIFIDQSIDFAARGMKKDYRVQVRK